MVEIRIKLGTETILLCQSVAVPRVDDFFEQRGRTYKVTRVTWQTDGCHLWAIVGVKDAR